MAVPDIWASLWSWSLTRLQSLPHCPRPLLQAATGNGEWGGHCREFSLHNPSKLCQPLPPLHPRPLPLLRLSHHPLLPPRLLRTQLHTPPETKGPEFNIIVS